jgi:hypothetical protein
MSSAPSWQSRLQPPQGKEEFMPSNKHSDHFKHALTLLLAALVLGLAVPRIAHAAPELINYQSKLMDSAGNPVNGTVSIVFRIYNQQSGGTTLWQETHNSIQVQEGIFSVLLGSVTPFPATLFEGDSRWLGIKVESDAEMIPRSRIASVAYAVRAEKAAEAETAGYAATAGSAPADNDWGVNGANVYIPSGSVGIGTDSPSSPLHVYSSTGDTNVTIESDGGDAVLEVDGTDAYVSFQHNGADKGYVGYRTAGDYLYLYKGGYVVVKDGKLGVGEMDPQTKLDVYGDVRIANTIIARDSSGLEFATDDATSRLKIDDNGNLGIGTTTPNHPVHAKKASGNYEVKIETDSGEADLFLDGTSGNSTVTFQQKGTYRGSVGYDTTNGYLFLYEDGKVVVDNGRLGVGTDSPTETLEVNGSVKVTGRCYGTFPRPAYDSGWVGLSAPGEKTLTHNVGGNVDNYVVDMIFKDSAVDGYGVSIVHFGGYRDTKDIGTGDFRGAYYRNLTSTQVTVYRYGDAYAADYVRIRIWTYN